MSSGTLYMYLEQVTITVSTKIELVSLLFTTITFGKCSLILCYKAIGIADGLNYR